MDKKIETGERKTVNWVKIKRLLKGELGLILILVALLAVFSFLSPYFFTSKNLLNITRQVSITLIVAIGMTFVTLTGEI
ncbi:MAG TPA: ribose ABC transporter permease, partial [Mesotoga sp.]|nr:ribose ABC transporter permease [Mesotoga sp.]